MVEFHYEKHGKGKNVIIFFHGFGENNEVFQSLIELLLESGSDLICYSIDIFYHGKSQGEEKPLTKDQWSDMFNQLLKAEKINSFSLVGFSLGARFVFTTALSYPEKIQSIFLLAPDGIYQSFWYQLAQTRPGNTIFKYLMQNPRSFNRLVNFLDYTGFVPKPVIKFIRKTLTTIEQRMRVYKVWTYFHPLWHTIEEIQEAFNRYQFPVFLILGQNDRITPTEMIQEKLSGIAQLKAIIIPARHHRILQESKEYIITQYKGLKL